MKQLHHTTAEPIETTLRAMSHRLVSLNQLHQRLRPHFARPEPHHHALRYLQAVLSEIPRKNGWQIAEHARLSQPSGIQRLLARATWYQDGVRNELRSFIRQVLSPLPLWLPGRSGRHRRNRFF